MLRSLLGESAWLVYTTAELSASCLDPMAMCLSPFPVLLRIGLLARLYCCVACLLKRGIYRSPIYWSAWHLQCAMERLAPAVRCLRSGSSIKRMAFPLGAQLALLVRGTAPVVAPHNGLPGVLSFPHQLIDLRPACGAWERQGCASLAAVIYVAPEIV